MGGQENWSVGPSAELAPDAAAAVARNDMDGGILLMFKDTVVRMQAFGTTRETDEVAMNFGRIILAIVKEGVARERARREAPNDAS